MRNIIVVRFIHVYREELLWLYQEGASYIFPDLWESFIEPIPVVERGDMISAYYRRLTGDNEEVKIDLLYTSALYQRHDYGDVSVICSSD